MNTGDRRYYLNIDQIKSLNISLIIQPSLSETLSIKLNNMRLNSLDIGRASDANIEISRSKINSVFIRNLSFKTFKIYDIKSRTEKGSVFEARNVDFSSSTFDKVDLASYELVSFYRSTLSGINFISPKFPTEIHALDNIHFPTVKEKDYYRMLSENYRQIKKSLSNSGNQLQALDIHSKMHSSLQKDTLLPRADRAILWLNKVSNNHGVSIIKPFILLLGFSFIFFVLYRNTLNEAPYEIDLSGIKLLGIGFKENIEFIFSDFRSFWILINPTHKLSTLELLEPETSLNSISLFISYASRIIMAWIIYQFITSFRKFSRKL